MPLHEIKPDATFLVTGAAGFLGSHLSEELLRCGYSVIGIDNFITGSKANLEHLESNPRFSFVENDIVEGFDSEVDGIFNLASPASPVQYQKDPVRTMKTNVMGTLNMLELAQRLAIPFLQASTSEIYGDPMVHPQTEDYWGNVNPIGPRACYDEGKRAAETLCFDYARQYDVSIRVPRIFNTYGPRMAAGDGRVVSNFIVQAILGKDITIFGDGSQTRSFCYVSDLVSGLMAMMFAPERVLGPVNLGNPLEVSVLQLAEIILRKTNSTSRIIFEPLPIDDPRQRRPDISLAEKTLGWSPKIPLEVGLERTIRYLHSKSSL